MLNSAQEIENLSFAIIEAEVPEPRPYQGELWSIARRCIHSVGDPSILSDLRLNVDALEAGVQALLQGCVVYTDTRMVAAGICGHRTAKLGAKVVPFADLDGLMKTAGQLHCTRSQAGLVCIEKKMQGQILIIGNAPTALLGLLDALDRGCPPPALVIGMPVGFVNAKESKDLLSQNTCKSFILLGRRGGSALAAACFNALAEIALHRQRSQAK